MTNRFGYWLGRALKRYPGIKLYAAVQMSNHFHFVLKDTSSELASFMRYFEANLAKATNQLRKRSGPVFHRRYSAEPILDEAAFDDRILYTVMNPVRAGLVRIHERWPGVVLLAKREPSKHVFKWFDQTKYDRQRKQQIVRPKEAYLRKIKIKVAPIPNEEALSNAIKEDEERTRELRKGFGVLGIRKVLKQDPFSAPHSPKKSPRPKCHTTCESEDNPGDNDDDSDANYTCSGSVRASCYRGIAYYAQDCAYEGFACLTGQGEENLSVAGCGREFTGCTRSDCRGDKVVTCDRGAEAVIDCRTMDASYSTCQLFQDSLRDSALTPMCSVPSSQRDCSGISATCEGNVAKVCVGGKLQSVDCSSVLPGGVCVLQTGNSEIDVRCRSTD